MHDREDPSAVRRGPVPVPSGVPGVSLRRISPNCYAGQYREHTFTIIRHPRKSSRHLWDVRLPGQVPHRGCGTRALAAAQAVRLIEGEKENP